jgi:hypothetical protein
MYSMQRAFGLEDETVAREHQLRREAGTPRQ